MDQLLKEISQCTLCEKHLPNKPRPIVQASIHSKIIIIGQAPGQKVQHSGIPWDDQSGDALRRWLGMTKEQFYDSNLFALIPMGFCYPGKGRSGDLPPRPECAPHWHDRLLGKMTKIKLILLIGKYAQQYYLGTHYTSSITENVRNFRDFLPGYLPLVHPSPRNKIWHKKNPWFEAEVIPQLQVIIEEEMVNKN